MNGVLAYGGTRGVGAAVAARAARQGRPVAVTYHADSGVADATVISLRALGVTDRAQVDRAAAAAREAIGPIDGLVLGANGIADHTPGRGTPSECRHHRRRPPH
jgi:3-oxoacyl-[acyl-carrier protein] reductase